MFRQYLFNRSFGKSRSFRIAAIAILLILLGSRPSFGIIVLDFEGVGDQAPVGNFYNGGGGPNFGVNFSANALGLVDADAGGSGNIGGEPSPDTVLFFLGGGAATMNVPAGFTTGFSFFYRAINNPGFINVYSGLNATGTLLTTLNLPLTPFNGAPDPTGQFSPLVPVGVTFSGTAMSVDFGGTLNQIVFDDVTIGSATPGTAAVPEASSVFAWFGVSLTLCLAAVLRRKKKCVT